MDTWTFIWFLVVLKIPVVALFLLVRWAIRQTPEAETATGQDGGIGPRGAPRHPFHPRPRLPRTPRRGPHGDQPLSPPMRVRGVTARAGRSAAPLTRTARRAELARSAM